MTIEIDEVFEQKEVQIILDALEAYYENLDYNVPEREITANLYNIILDRYNTEYNE